MPLLISLSLVIEKLTKLHAHAPGFGALRVLRLRNELHFVAPAFRTRADVHHGKVLVGTFSALGPVPGPQDTRRQVADWF